jgi:membrane protease YdiL (CAAX protease family)
VSAAFGAMHGALWLPGLLAGLSYGLLLIRTGKIGESVVAHATTNALLALYVVYFDQWQLW